MIIWGTGETAKLARYYFERDTYHRVKVFGDREEYGVKEFDELPVITDNFFNGEFGRLHIALSYKGMNKAREAVFDNFKHLPLLSYLSPHAQIMTEDIGLNAFILENNVVQPGTVLGNNVMLWSGNHIGHGSHIGDHTYFSSHVVLSGHCRVGKRCFFGVNAAVKDFTTIGDDCFITMGAIVTKDMPDGSVAIDREIITGDKAQKIKDRYFDV